MLKFLNRVSGTILGVGLYPITSLVINLALGTVIFIVGALGSFIASFLIFGSTWEQFEESYGFLRALLQLGLIFIAPPIVFFGVVILAGAALITLVALTFYDLFTSMVLGLKDGYEYGFSGVVSDGIWSYDSIPHLLSSSIRLINRFLKKTENEGPEATDNGLQKTANDGVDEGDEKFECDLLSDEELEKASQFSELGLDLQRYKALFEKLDILDRAIRVRSLLGASTEELPEVEYNGVNMLVEDELIVSMPIYTPSLIVKQYEVEPGHWKAVPVSTYIIDQSNFKNYQDHNKNHAKLLHPLTRDLILSPEAYNGKCTRYNFLNYHSKIDAQELVEATSSIRKRLVFLESQNACPVEDSCHQFLGLYSQRSTNAVEAQQAASVFDFSSGR